jgi:hypothetical protein
MVDIRENPEMNICYPGFTPFNVGIHIDTVFGHLVCYLVDIHTLAS